MIFRRFWRWILRKLGRLPADPPALLDPNQRFLIRRVVDGQEYIGYRGDDVHAAKRIWNEYTTSHRGRVEWWDQETCRGIRIG